jgi:hypothetical protein
MFALVRGHLQLALGWTWLDSMSLLMLHICSTTGEGASLIALKSAKEASFQCTSCCDGQSERVGVQAPSLVEVADGEQDVVDRSRPQTLRLSGAYVRRLFRAVLRLLPAGREHLQKVVNKILVESRSAIQPFISLPLVRVEGGWMVLKELSEPPTEYFGRPEDDPVVRRCEGGPD